jgi:hypothetical protein
LNGVASFLGARINIGTNHWGVSAVTRSNIARVNSACISIITVLSNVLAVSGSGIARVDGAWVVIVTVLRVSVETVLGVASRDGASICSSRDWDWSEDAFSGSLVASISGTCIVVVTDHWGIDASGGRVASINGASISVVASVVGMLASFNCIARVISTSIAVVTADWSVFALSRSLVARVGGADIGVITVNIFGVETFVKGAEPDGTFVGASCILRCKIDWSVDASFNNIASIGGARVAVITNDSIVVNSSSCGVAVVSGASVLVINCNIGEDASVARLASINGARIAVVTSDWGGDASLYNIARVFCAFVCISAIDCCVFTLTGAEIASVQSTCIVVVTVDISVDAFSRRCIASNGLAWFSSANNWGVDAVSVGARVGGAQVVVVTDFVGVLASFYGIARSDGAFVSVIASNWHVLDSIANGASINGASIVIINANRGVLASGGWVASINGTWVLVITVNRSVDALFLVNRASVNGANVVVIAMGCSNIGEDASSCRVARFVSARVLVVANNNIVVDSSSNCITPVGGAFVVVINIHWGVYAFSGGLVASIGGARIFVITNNRGFDDSGVAIASLDDTRIAVVNRN